ncbi:MAG: hypothetical protein Q7R35_02915 [Elusimicrobiota bacterium]|nr:hypothetical protein [Elusimicrobiota bacterium]
MSYFESSSEFFKIFGIDENSDYKTFLRLDDIKVGFSIQREYPKDGRYKPPTLKDGTPDVIAIIHVAYNQEGAHPKIEITDERVPIRITVTWGSKWLANHVSYDFENKECPTKESIDISNKTPSPYHSSVEGYFDHKQNKFILGTGENLEPKGLLDSVFENNLKAPSYLFILRRKSKNTVRDLNRILIKIARYFLELIWNWQIEDRISARNYLTGYLESEVIKQPRKELDLFGYKTSTETIVGFCCLIIITFLACHLLGGSSPLLKSVLNNGFLTSICVLVALYIFDKVVPRLLLELINILIRFRTEWL